MADFLTKAAGTALVMLILRVILGIIIPSLSLNSNGAVTAYIFFGGATVILGAGAIIAAIWEG